MKNYFLLRVKGGRFALLEKRTDRIVGLLLACMKEGEGGSFVRNVGPTYGPEAIINLDEFPELRGLKIWAIEYCRDEELANLVLV